MNKQLSVKTYAKINLTLDVTEKRYDGYHNIDSIFEEISLFDTVTVSITDRGKTNVSCSEKDIPINENNIAFKAAEAFFEKTKIHNPGVDIFIEKKIPSQAGMGGGSTNAAGVIRILNNIFETGLSDEKLMKIALPVGADTPFFIKGGIAHITGIGEIISPLEPLSEHFIVVAKGDQGVSTPDAYRQIDSLKNVPHQNTEKILNAVANDDITTLMENSLNTFELTKLPDDIQKIKEIMKKHNAIKTMMTGSGAAVFGIFKERKTADAVCDELKKAFSFSGVYTNICGDRNTFR
ncbi:MAG: 4-(cytidine 5'-diphospho)-2-C-methyl-D-erythritol kinase [Ruminococcus sp.]|nr:4-(cytidine 5'-diphospho)-2-C-methyl-D-erythritol kinase [Ruminococcus sp.]